ncbi:MAG: hypothetical protein ACXW3G_11960 [Rhodoplanes sp.]
MAIFTRYARVLEADDTAMTVKTALQLINQALDEYLSEQEAEYDADTRFAITWFESYGMEPGLAGQANVLANARNVSVTGVAASGILALKGDKVRLLGRGELPAGRDPGNDPRLTVWECTQHLIRVLQDQGEQAAAGLLARLGARADPARDLRLPPLRHLQPQEVGGGGHRLQQPRRRLAGARPPRRPGPGCGCAAR